MSRVGCRGPPRVRCMAATCPVYGHCAWDVCGSSESSWLVVVLCRPVPSASSNEIPCTWLMACWRSRQQLTSSIPDTSRGISVSRFVGRDRHMCPGHGIGPPKPLPKPTFRPLADAVLHCPRQERRLIHETAIVPARLRCAKDTPNAGLGAFGRLTVSSLSLCRRT